MSPWDWAQIVLYLGVLLLCVNPLGLYMAAAYEGCAPRSFVSWRRWGGASIGAAA